MIELNQIICGDALTILKSMPSDFVDCVITSPPYYSLRDYQIEGQIGLEPTFDNYANNLIQVFAEVKRVLKPTGAFWLNMGDAYASKGNQRFDKNKYGSKEGLHCGKARMKNYPDKCMLMMPERIAIRCIDELGFILRNKCHWVKQILDIKNNRTYGSVLPTSTKDRLNESGELFYFFTKNKRYYSNLDAVRIPHQVEGVTDLRPPGLLRCKMYAGSKYNQFDFRPDGNAESKLSPQEEEKLTSYIARKYGYDPEGICPVCNRTWKRHASPNASDRKAGLRREFIPCITQAKYLSLSPENAENYNSPRAREVRKRKKTIPGEPNAFHPLGKNIPTYHLIAEEGNKFIPFSLEKQITICSIKEFENLKNITAFIENQLINSSFGMQFGINMSIDDREKFISDTIQEFFCAREMQPYLTLFRGSPYATIAIKNTSNEISIIFGRNRWIFCREGFTVEDFPFVERDYKWFAINCNSVIGFIFPLFNWVRGLQFGTDYIQQLNILRCEFELRSLFGNITISDKQSQEIGRGRSNFAKIFFIETIFSSIGKICRIAISNQSMIMTTTKLAVNCLSPTINNGTDKVNSFSWHILNITDYLEKVKSFPTYWLLNPQPRNFKKELDIDIEHFACFPDRLVEIPILFSCPQKGLVLDPFCGSGTTLLIAQKLDRNYIGIDINPDYCQLAEKRLSKQNVNYSLELFP